MLKKPVSIYLYFLGQYGPPLSADEYAVGRMIIGGQMPGHFGNDSQYDPLSKQGKNLLANVYDTWPTGVINYKIDAAFTSLERTAIAAGIADTTDNTCLEFNDAGSNPMEDFIFITTGVDSNGCFFRGRGYTQWQGAHILNLVQLPFCSQVSLRHIYK